MGSLALMQWSGLAGIIGGMLWIMLWFLIVFSSDDPPLGLDPTIYIKVLPIPFLLFLATLLGAHAHLVDRTPRLGWTSLIMAGSGLMLLFVGNVMSYWLLSVAGVFIVLLGIIVLFFGMILFTIAALKARVLPSWSRAVPLILGILALPQYIANSVGALIFGDMPGLVLSALFGLGWALLGFALWSDARTRQLSTPRLLPHE